MLRLFKQYTLLKETPFLDNLRFKELFFPEYQLYALSLCSGNVKNLYSELISASGCALCKAAGLYTYRARRSILPLIGSISTCDSIVSGRSLHSFDASLLGLKVCCLYLIRMLYVVYTAVCTANHIKAVPLFITLFANGHEEFQCALLYRQMLVGFVNQNRAPVAVTISRHFYPWHSFGGHAYDKAVAIDQNILGTHIGIRNCFYIITASITLFMRARINFLIIKKIKK